MKIQIENLRAQMRGVELNNYQRGLALNEYEKLLEYVEELEQCNIASVSNNEVAVCENCDLFNACPWVKEFENNGCKNFKQTDC